MNPINTSNLITGIHHVTAISGNAQPNIDFYTGILGLRLVKQTVNFDYPEVYHFYFGDNAGAPGSIMTTFPYGDDLTNGRPTPARPSPRERCRRSLRYGGFTTWRCGLRASNGRPHCSRRQ